MILEALALVCCVLAPSGFQSCASLQVTLLSDSDRPCPWRPPEWNSFLYTSGESEFLILSTVQSSDYQQLIVKSWRKTIQHRSMARRPCKISMLQCTCTVVFMRNITKPPDCRRGYGRGRESIIDTDVQVWVHLQKYVYDWNGILISRLITHQSY